MNYHYEVCMSCVLLHYNAFATSLFLCQTQPVPNPISYYLHQSPEAIHQLETLGNHVVELAVPFLLFLPRPLRMAGGLIQILFQVRLCLLQYGYFIHLEWFSIPVRIYQCLYQNTIGLCMYILCCAGVVARWF